MTLHKDGSSAVLKKEKTKYYNTGYSYLVTHPRTNFTQEGLTLLSERNILLSQWYSDSTLNAFSSIPKMRKGIKKRKKSLILHGWESREQKIEEYENGNNYLLWRSDKRRFPYNYCLSLSDEDNSDSRTDNLVNVNVTFQQCYISSCTLLPLHFELFS